MERTSENQAATPLELFFDLVFVFALTQVTAFMADDLTTTGIVRGLLILGLLWWSWVGYAWLCNLVRADEGAVRLVLLAAMAIMFVLALAIPEAFVDRPGGLSGPVVVAVCYFAFRLTHVLLFWVYARDDPVLRSQLLKFMPSMLGGTILLLVASRYDGDTQTLLWCAALAADYIGTFLGGANGWRLRSPSHFAERHGLILIVALGESIVAIGVGATGLPISWPVVAAGALGLALASGLWWLYFDVSALYGEEALAAAPDDGRRTAMARDAYSFLHLPLMVGVVLLALGLKKVLEYVGDTEHHDLSDPLKGWALGALFAGALVYLLGHIGFKLRTKRVLSRPRLVLAASVGLAWPAVAGRPALLQLAVVTVLVAALVGFETIHYAEQRRALRHAGHDHG